MTRDALRMIKQNVYGRCFGFTPWRMTDSTLVHPFCVRISHTFIPWLNWQHTNKMEYLLPKVMVTKYIMIGFMICFYWIIKFKTLGRAWRPSAKWRPLIRWGPAGTSPLPMRVPSIRLGPCIFILKYIFNKMNWQIYQFRVKRDLSCSSLMPKSSMGWLRQ